MEKDNKPSATDTKDSELKSLEKKEDVSKTETLESEKVDEAEYYKKLTGREDIKSKEDFGKHYEGLKSLVGDQKVAEMRTKAEKFDILQKEINKEAEDFLGTEEGKKLTEEKKGEVIEERVSTLEDKTKKRDFLVSHPEAEPLMSLVKTKADRNEISLEDAFIKPLEGEKYSLKELLDSRLEVDKTKEEEKSIGVDSKQRSGVIASQEATQLVEKVEKSDSFEDKQKLVEKVLDIGE